MKKPMMVIRSALPTPEEKGSSEAIEIISNIYIIIMKRLYLQFLEVERGQYRSAG